MNALFALMHNGYVIHEAERALQKAVENDRTEIYVENPDGTRVRLQPGFKLIDFEWAPIITDKKMMEDSI